MEFRCPACNTSYRVPVRINQQVRCARCNHVWRVAETDFVFTDQDDENESEMPEAFSAPGSDDEYSNAHEDPRAQASAPQVDDDLSDMLERREIWPNAWENRPAASAWAQDVADETRADFGADESGAYPGAAHDDNARDHDVSQAGMEPDTEPRHSTFHDNDPAPTADAPHTLDQQIADGWFSRADAEDGAGQPQSEAHAAAFERIMEGIEEVISEGGNRDTNTSAEPVSPSADDPLSALLDGARGQGLEEPDERTQHAQPEGNDPWQGKVVHLSARGAAAGRDATQRNEAEDDERSADVPMAELIDKLAPGAQETADDNTTERGVEPAEAADMPWVSTLPANLEDIAADETASTVETTAAEASAGWDDNSYHDPAHEAAQRESLAFDPNQDDFDDHDEDERDAEFYPASEPVNDRGGPLRHPDADAEPGRGQNNSSWREDRTDIFTQANDQSDHEPLAARAHLDPEDDDALLAEYDFGDDEADATPHPEPERRGAGTLTIVAAWALFLIIVAAAGVSTISFRNQIAGALPAAAPVYAAVGFPVDEAPLALDDVSYALQGEPPEVLTLNGRVTNVSNELIEMPDLKIRVRDEADETLVEDERFLGKAALLPGETMDFSVNLEVQAERLRTVELRF